MAAISVVLMFAGAFILPVTALGFAFMGAGTIALLILILLAVSGKS